MGLLTWAPRLCREGKEVCVWGEHVYVDHYLRVSKWGGLHCYLGGSKVFMTLVTAASPSNLVSEIKDDTRKEWLRIKESDGKWRQRCQVLFLLLVTHWNLQAQVKSWYFQQVGSKFHLYRTQTSAKLTLLLDIKQWLPLENEEKEMIKWGKWGILKTSNALFVKTRFCA
jgi:hypothetical protein